MLLSVLLFSCLLACLCAFAAVLVWWVLTLCRRSTPPGLTIAALVVPSLTSSDLSLAQTLLHFRRSRSVALPFASAGPNPATPMAPVVHTPRRTTTTRQHSPAVGTNITSPQLGQPDLPTTKYSIALGVRGGNVPDLWFRRVVDFLKEKALAGAVSTEIGGVLRFCRSIGIIGKRCSDLSERWCTFHMIIVACATCAGKAERLHVQGIMLAHGLTTQTFCDDLATQLKCYIPIQQGTRGNVKIKVLQTPIMWQAFATKRSSILSGLTIEVLSLAVTTNGASHA